MLVSQSVTLLIGLKILAGLSSSSSLTWEVYPNSCLGMMRYINVLLLLSIPHSHIGCMIMTLMIVRLLLRGITHVLLWMLILNFLLAISRCHPINSCLVMLVVIGRLMIREGSHSCDGGATKTVLILFGNLGDSTNLCGLVLRGVIRTR
jgi:hypothetical protein